MIFDRCMYLGQVQKLTSAKQGTIVTIYIVQIDIVFSLESIDTSRRLVIKI